MARKTARNMALWVSADLTAPDSGDAVLYITSLSPQYERPETDQSAAGDDFGVWVGGNPQGTLTVGVRADVADPQLFDEFLAGSTHKVYALPDADVTTDYWDFNAYIVSWSQTGAFDGGWDGEIKLRLVTAPTWNAA